MDLDVCNRVFWTGTTSAHVHALSHHHALSHALVLLRVPGAHVVLLGVTLNDGIY